MVKLYYCSEKHFVFEDIEGYELIGNVEESIAIEEYDDNFEMVLKYFAEEAIFTQRVRLLTDKPVTVKGYVNFMCCDDTKCLPPDDEEFSFTFHGDQDASTQLSSESVEKKEVSVPGLESLSVGVGEEK